jgi:hypothetical protein
VKNAIGSSLETFFSSEESLPKNFLRRTSSEELPQRNLLNQLAYRVVYIPHSHSYLRVIDESGENYAYAAVRFLRLALSPQAEETLLAVL